MLVAQKLITCFLGARQLFSFKIRSSMLRPGWQHLIAAIISLGSPFCTHTHTHAYTQNTHTCTHMHTHTRTQHTQALGIHALCLTASLAVHKRARASFKALQGSNGGNNSSSSGDPYRHSKAEGGPPFGSTKICSSGSSSSSAVAASHTDVQGRGSIKPETACRFDLSRRSVFTERQDLLNLEEVGGVAAAVPICRAHGTLVYFMMRYRRGSSGICWGYELSNGEQAFSVSAC